jgi:hypothetical protein
MMAIGNVGQERSVAPEEEATVKKPIILVVNEGGAGGGAINLPLPGHFKMDTFGILIGDYR